MMHAQRALFDTADARAAHDDRSTRRARPRAAYRVPARRVPRTAYRAHRAPRTAYRGYAGVPLTEKRR
jgi:hypothetical protein